MLDITPSELYDEIGRARRLSESVNASRESMIKAYAGEHYRSDWKPDDVKMIDNRFDEWMRLVLPQLIHDNPRVRVHARRSGVHASVPLALQAAINWWAPQVGLYRVLRDAVYDAAFTYGVVMTTYGPKPGREPHRSEEDAQVLQSLPRVSRIDPKRWFCDHAADSYDPANGHGRLAGHLFRADAKHLARDGRYNAEAITKAKMDGDKLYGGERSEREEVYGYEVWIPEIQTGDDPAANGTIYTIAVNQSSDSRSNAMWLREPRAYIGPACGPYALFGLGRVPGCPYPYSPFAASWDQIKAMNEHKVAAENTARNAKTIIGVDSDNNQALDIIRKAKHGDGVAIDDLKSAVQQITIGGVTNDQRQHIATLSEQADRSLSLSETARGNVNVDTSATAITDAANQRNNRIASMKRMTLDAAAQVLSTAAWHLYTHQDAAFHLPPEIANTFVPRPKDLPPPDMAEPLAKAAGVSVFEMRQLLEHQPEVIFAGGESDQLITEIDESYAGGGVAYVVRPNLKGSRFEDYELEIEPYSMERVDESLLQRRAMQVFQVVTSSLPLIQQFPDVDWEGMLDMIGEPMNINGMAEKTLGQKFLARLRESHQAAAAMAGQAIPQGADMMAGPADGMSSVRGQATEQGGELAAAQRV